MRVTCKFPKHLQTFLSSFLTRSIELSNIISNRKKLKNLKEKSFVFYAFIDFRLHKVRLRFRPRNK